MPTRKEYVEQAIERGDVAELLKLAEPGWCGCRGKFDGEPECWCVMSRRQVCEAVSLDELRRGRLVKLSR